MRSPVSSPSSSPAPESETTMTAPETMQIFIKTMTGETVPLTVSSTATVADLKIVISEHSLLPNGNVRLLFAGRSLTDTSSLLTSHSVRPETTISLALPLKGGAGKLPRCDYKKATPDKCTKPIERIVGDCGFCGGHFCSRHRLLESHSCEGLEDCKKESHERNADKLNSERTVAIKGI